MQDDDTANPGMLLVLERRQRSGPKPAGAAGKSCADCHGDAASMKGVAARYPAFDTGRGRPSISKAASISAGPQPAGRPLAPESRELLALTAYVAHQSRGLPIATADDPRCAVPRRRARAIFQRARASSTSPAPLPRRQCRQEARGRHHPAGASDRLSALPAGVAGPGLAQAAAAQLPGRHPRRALPYDAPEYVALELFLMDRAKGMTFELPGVRP